MTSVCDEITYKLSAYLDNELPDEEKSKVEAHLKACPSCQRSLQKLKKSSELIATALSARPAVDFDKAWENIEARIHSRPTIWQYLRAFMARPGFWIPAGAAGAVGAVAMLLVLCLPIYKSQPPANLSRVESVSSKTGRIMVLQTAKTSQPLIWIMENPPKEKRI